ncbi:MAG: ABC transporter ATP-binding protein [Chloroflexi bacterium]|mgnify:CR=1 FL=1|nr:ABC transporter ATP-binding protein [Chloroflexota bacterium]
MAATDKRTYLDLRATLSDNRLLGLWRLATGYRLPYLWATLSLAVATIAKTTTYLLLAYFVDHVLGQNRGTAILAWVAAGFVGLAALEGGSSLLSGWLTAKTSEGIIRRLRNYLFDQVQRLSFAYHSKTKTGDLIQRSTSDVDAVRRFYADQAIGMARIAISFAINWAALLNLSWQLGLISVLVIPPVVAVSVYFFRRVSKVYEGYQEQEAKLSTVLQENLSGVRVVKAFARQDYERAKFEAENIEKFRRGKKMTNMHATYWPLTDILCGVQMVGGYIVGALMAINGDISVGTYLAYTALITRIIWPMRNLGRLIVQTSTGLVSYGRLVEIIKQDREPMDEGDYLPEGPVRGEVAFDRVSFAYEGDQAVLEDIDLHCAPGAVVALLGSTGSGKTSLVNLLPRFYEYSGGSLRLDGVELNRYPRRYLRQQIGIVEQEPFLFSRSIRENITYGVGREVSDEEVEAAARAAAIHDVIMTFPEGYKTLVGEKGVTLSGGQKQRVSIARTLLKNPRILILDDSTSSVDTETEADIREALEKLMQDRTTFIIAHRVQSVQNADAILVMDKGRIVERGTHQELLATGGTYRRIYDMQARIEAELEREVSGV